MPINLSDAKIKENLEFLNRKLPHIPTAIDGFFSLPKEYKNEVLRSGYSESSLQKISDHIGLFLGILSKVKVSLVDEATDPRWTISNAGVVFTGSSGANYSGLYRTLGYDHNEILLVKKFKYQLRNILAILAHESVHHYLSYYGVKKNNENENEILTDVGSAYLGLGQLLVEGYRPIVWTSDYYNYLVVSGHTTHTATIGYVTPNTIKRAIFLTTELRGWSPREVVRSFTSFADRLNAYFVLWPYRSEVNKNYRKEKQRLAVESKKIGKEAARKKSLQELLGIHQKLIKDFEEFSKTPNISKVLPQDGSGFMELASDISQGTVDHEIDRLLKEVPGEGTDQKQDVEKITQRIKEWRRLLTKYNN